MGKGADPDGAKTKLAFVEPKSETSRRMIPLPPVIVDILRRHRTEQKKQRLLAGSDWREQGLVFTSSVGTPVDERNLRRAYKEILEAANLGQLRIHDLRHTCASLLLAQGVNIKVVSEVLGHSQVGITLNTYSHVPSLKEDAAERMDALLSQPATKGRKDANEKTQAVS